MIASLDQIEIDECQALCRDTYSTNCQLFSYDMRMKKCVLWKERDLVLGRCTVKSGPSDTTHADICLTDVDNWTEKSCHVKLYPVMIYDTEKYRSCNIIFVLQVLRFTSVQFYIVFQAFRLGYCHNAGDLIGHLGNISDELSCQRACSTVHNCDQYRYDYVTHDCSILSNSSLGKDNDCDLIYGPSSPPVNECGLFYL